MREQKHETRAKKAKLAIIYITCGTLVLVWSLIWLFYLAFPDLASGRVYIAGGLALSGIVVVLIGVKVGDIGKEANRDEEVYDQGREDANRVPDTQSNGDASVPASSNVNVGSRSANPTTSEAAH